MAEFRSNGVGVLGVTALCEALKNNDMLSSLLLGTNSIGDEGAEILARYLAGARPVSCFIASKQCDRSPGLIEYQYPKTCRHKWPGYLQYPS